MIFSKQFEKSKSNIRRLYSQSGVGSRMARPINYTSCAGYFSTGDPARGPNLATMHCESNFLLSDKSKRFRGNNYKHHEAFIMKGTTYWRTNSPQPFNAVR